MKSAIAILSSNDLEAVVQWKRAVMEVGESIAIVVEVKIASHDDSSNCFILAFWSTFLKIW
jgi:hypothetical protein